MKAAMVYYKALSQNLPETGLTLFYIYTESQHILYFDSSKYIPVIFEVLAAMG
jgi:hypothetical protein